MSFNYGLLFSTAFGSRPDRKFRIILHQQRGYIGNGIIKNK